MKPKTGGEVEGNEIALEVVAGLEEEFFGCWAQGNEVIKKGEGGEAVVGGWVGEEDGGAG